jgi:hypothetical protein
MNIFTRLKEWVFHLGGGKELGDNPFADRYVFINSDEMLRQVSLAEYKVWYEGDGDELQNFYTMAMIKNWNYNTIYTRNKRQYFWAIAVSESDFKRVHSGVPRAIVDTLVNIVGAPKFDAGTNTERLQKIIQQNNLLYTIVQRQMPMTLVLGCGAFKPTIGRGIGFPTVSFYEAQDVDFAYKDDVLQGVAFKDYFKSEDGKKDYMLVETRETHDGNSYVTYKLYELSAKEEGREVPLDTLGQTKGLSDVVIAGVPFPLAVPSVFFDDPLHPHMGRSIFQGKTDKFDSLDMEMTLRYRTVEKSDPIEYVPEDLLPIDPKTKQKTMPSRFNREFVEIGGVPDGDGKSGSQIQTSQPALNFQQYSDVIIAEINEILIGVMSPASLGIGVAKKDNADAQREKEKATILTRNTIISQEMRILDELGTQMLIMQDIIDSGGTVDMSVDRTVNVSFMEFANPSFENELNTLYPAWQNGALSTEKYVDLVWRDKMSEEEKAKEVVRLNEARREALYAPTAYEANNGTIPSGNSPKEEESQG